MVLLIKYLSLFECIYLLGRLISLRDATVFIKQQQQLYLHVAIGGESLQTKQIHLRLWAEINGFVD